MNAWEEPGLFFGCLGLYETWDVLNAVRQQRQAQKTPGAYLSRERITFGIWLACASMAVEACCRIWPLVRLAVSAA